MQVIYDAAIMRHVPSVEMHRGQSLPSFERPERVQSILSALEDGSFATIAKPNRYDLSVLQRVHDAGYIRFIRTAHAKWTGLGLEGHIVPHVWPSRCMNPQPPDSIFGQLGFYSYDAGTTIASGTWDTVWASAQCAMTAVEACLKGQEPVFALCRPPGHHAERAAYGGYCFLNNAALAAQQFVELGNRKVAILDVDYHHGNGTQSIFYERGDVMFVSIHADPKNAYPYFCGYETEIGSGSGTGTNLNLCLPDAANWPIYRAALQKAMDAIVSFGPQSLIVSFGADTYRDDPISTFALETDDYARLGKQVKEFGLPCVVVMEGGYAIEDLGRNVFAFLSALE